MPSVAAQLVVRNVSTEEELRAALFNDPTNSSLYGLQGRRIVICRAITLTSPVVIDTPGVIIESNGFLPISIEAGLDSAFDIAGGYQVEMRGLNFPALDGNLPTTAWIKAGTSTIITSCSAPSGGTLVRVDLQAEIQIIGNYSAVGKLCVLHDSEECVVVGNLFTTIEVTGTSARNTITGNSGNAGGGAILTSTSSGGHSIVGNTNCTVTATATDAVTSNGPGPILTKLQPIEEAVAPTAANDVLTYDGAGGYFWAPAGGGGGGFFGQTTATFSGGADSVTVSVVDAGVSAGSNIIPTVALVGRDLDEMEMAPVVVAVGTITAGVGFDLIAVSLDGDAEGVYTINYTRD